MQKSYKANNKSEIADSELNTSNGNISTASDENPYVEPEIGPNANPVAHPKPAPSNPDVPSCPSKFTFKLPEVSASVEDMMINGPDETFFKRIYGTGNSSEFEQKKKAFTCAFELWEK